MTLDLDALEKVAQEELAAQAATPSKHYCSDGALQELIDSPAIPAERGDGQ